ncbi:MAG TPA: c-type cytochrome [Flavisolibacter sp.]|nr:c-type cytochrome [Flavisolibacter sp.]
MRYTKLTFAALSFAALAAWSCQSGNTEEKKADEPLVKASFTKEEMISRGQILVTAGGCNDCHSPKKMGPHGPAIDSTRMLSGHPAEMPNPPVIASALQPGNWVLMGPAITSFVGPWGVSYAANLTPDTTSGLGSWTEGNFIQTLRTGRHMGLENGRPLLPPMPWENLSKLSDDDLKSIFAYLQSLPAINNRVPGPVSPDKAVLK